MTISSKLDKLHLHARQNKWLWYFYIFNRIALAVGFFAAGMVKIVGERFASGLSNNHPMGHYLEALFHTGYYYTFIGVAQIIAAILLLIPPTVTLGALLYLPIILNICILSYAVRFEGSQLTSPLMLLGNIYLLCWNYEKIKYILPFNHTATAIASAGLKPINNKFPAKFFAGVITIVFALGMITTHHFRIVPRNNLKDCNAQFKGTNRTKAGETFCDCIHNEGKPLDECLNKYEKTPDDNLAK